jgi:RNA polymerase sigma factor (sigma-70 family)
MSTIDAIQCPIMNASELVLLESDTELLRSFVAESREAAFVELMRRHGPMVMGVCRRTLREGHDAEDAYQATFLLLVQKSAAIRRPERLANWLFGVAYRVAARIRAKAVKQESLQMHSLEPLMEDNTVEVARRELQSVLDEELHRLPETYRLPLILCYLEGKTHTEAARELGWPSGSMSSRLTQAREKLRRRLTRRGLIFTSAIFGIMLSEKTYAGTLSPTLLQDTTRAAMGCVSGKPLCAEVVSAQVAGLVTELNKCMFVAKAKEITVLMLLSLLLLGCTGTAVRVVHGDMKERADRRGETIPPPMTWIVQSGRSAIVSLMRPRSADGAITDVRSTSTTAATCASTPSCSQH